MKVRSVAVVLVASLCASAMSVSGQQPQQGQQVTLSQALLAQGDQLQALASQATQLRNVAGQLERFVQIQREMMDAVIAAYDSEGHVGLAEAIDAMRGDS